MNVEVVIEGLGERRVERRVATEPLSVGRDSACSVHLPDHRISRRHAVLHATEHCLQVEDTSSNGTVAGNALLRHEIAEVPYGTPILLGLHTLYVRREAGPRSPELTDAALANRPAHSPARTSQAPAATALDSARHAVLVQSVDEVAKLLAESPSLASPPAVLPAPFTSLVASQDSESELRREIHQRLLKHLDLAALDGKRLDDAAFRPRVLTALRRIIRSIQAQLPPGTDTDRLVGEMADEALGLGPLEHLLSDASVTEIMVINAETIYVERGGKLVRTAARFTDDERVRAVIERIVTPLGRRIDESCPLVDARLSDGSRVNAIIRPLALKGSCITIRKFSKAPLSLQRLYDYGALTEAMGRFLTRSVEAKRNIVISGGTGSGKTTLLNVLSSAIPTDERIITIEDSAELRLGQPHVVSLETRPANMEGTGAYTIRDLLKNALRMRPDRIVIGECRGGEALDMLQAMNTGHDGSLTTTHANSPAEALARLETLSLMAGVDLPARAIREQIAASVHLVVQQSRLSDGSRKVTAISELCGIDSDGSFKLRAIYGFVRTGTRADGKVLGEFTATGCLPSFLGDFIVRGLVKPGEPYL